jgi:hypothetical protein
MALDHKPPALAERSSYSTLWFPGNAKPPLAIVFGETGHESETLLAITRSARYGAAISTMADTSRPSNPGR